MDLGNGYTEIIAYRLRKQINSSWINSKPVIRGGRAFRAPVLNNRYIAQFLCEMCPKKSDQRSETARKSSKLFVRKHCRHRVVTSSQSRRKNTSILPLQNAVLQPEAPGPGSFQRLSKQNWNQPAFRRQCWPTVATITPNAMFNECRPLRYILQRLAAKRAVKMTIASNFSSANEIAHFLQYRENRPMRRKNMQSRLQTKIYIQIELAKTSPFSFACSPPPPPPSSSSSSWSSSFYLCSCSAPSGTCVLSASSSPTAASLWTYLCYRYCHHDRHPQAHGTSMLPAPLRSATTSSVTCMY